jgi:hypothetical protein
MSNRLVTLATFPIPATAGFIKSLLVAEGVQALLADEFMVGMYWHLGNSMGWVKVQVAEADVSRANEILEAYRETLADLGQQAFVAEATACAAVDESPEAAPLMATADELDYGVLDPTEELADRALRSALMGLGCFPLAFYGAWLVGRLMRSNSKLSAKAARDLWLAFVITFMYFVGYSIIIGRGALLAWIGSVGAYSIRTFVRWINRRDDPRHAARPIA